MHGTIPAMESADLNEVMIFTRVVEAQGFSAAAKLLGLPKSTVSRKVTQLEHRLGVPLLMRTTRRLHLTEPGAAYYERCARIVSELDEAERAVREQRATPKGTLRVTAPVDFALMHMGELVTAYMRKYPEVDVVLALTSRRVDLVAEGIDLALRGGHLDDSSLVARKLVDSTFGVFASSAYLKKHGTPNTAAELSEHQCVALGLQARTVWKLNCGARKVEIRIKARVCADDFGVVQQLVIAGAGIGMMPVYNSAEAVRKKQLVRLFPDHAFEGGAFYVVYPSTRQLSAATRTFIDFTAAWMAKVWEPE
jgi:DNA-binding transcriptional LysR family regulator